MTPLSKSLASLVMVALAALLAHSAGARAQEESERDIITAKIYQVVRTAGCPSAQQVCTLDLPKPAAILRIEQISCAFVAINTVGISDIRLTTAKGDGSFLRLKTDGSLVGNGTIEYRLTMPVVYYVPAGKSPRFSVTASGSGLRSMNCTMAGVF